MQSISTEQPFTEYPVRQVTLADIPKWHVLIYFVFYFFECSHSCLLWFLKLAEVANVQNRGGVN